MNAIKNITVKMENLEIIARKGLYETELMVENHFLVSLYVSYDAQILPVPGYINYEILAEICKRNMHANIMMIEETGGLILQEVSTHFDFAGSARVSIHKKNPAFENYRIGSVGVEMEISWDSKTISPEQL
ncbi:MAG: dihydroneopterin aldolase [Bacteroidia bacterium]|nr:dihydroneopterin aldolase [Bacteroidia bacterium]